MAQDYTGLPEELKAKLIKWEANTPAHKQVAILSDIADISQEMLNVIEKNDPNSNLEKMGALLVDMRGALRDLNDKEAPEVPDTSKPVIDAISKLEKALTASIKAIDTKPVVNVPQAKAPVVNVDAPVVTLDNKEVAKILKTDIPKAFNEAIQSIVIPENDDTETNILLQELSEKLDNINTGVRLKPIAPKLVSSKITDGTNTADVVQLGTAINTSDYGLVTNTVIHGQTTAGGGSYVDVKVSPSGAIQVGGLLDTATTTTSTHSNVANSVTSVTLLSANTSRKSATIYNDDSAASLYVKFGTTASSTSYKIKIAPGGYYEFPMPIYTGRVDGIATAATGTARICEET